MRKILATFLTGLMLSFGAIAQTTAIDINTADAPTLARALNGVGPAKAEAIIAYREAHGPFQHVDELARVKGIGPATIDLNRAVMSVQPTAPTATAIATLPASAQPAASAAAARPASPNR
ncbi:MAG: ComEA family DNA-binding protein [Xanthomonadales bacterium]|jgi:competence protein ComEA|nr:ComEA family DNA-binding protein [Xanthomonadales bacterium]